MKTTLTILLALTLTAPVMALDLGNTAASKPDVSYPVRPGQPDRQGGDTIADAVALTWPVVGLTGSTVGYANDYDEVCPYSGSTSPDVVYSITNSPYGVSVDIDLYGSTYDTKLYVYDDNLELVACNDDFYADYVSKIEALHLDGGTTYYVVIDGYGGDSGDYVLTITEFTGHGVGCYGPDPQMEGEPELVDGYVDAFNGGCNSPESGNPFGVITQPFFCGVSGWYQSADGSDTRDTDWFEIVVPEVGYLEVTGNADYPTYLFELGPQDCGSVGVIQNVICGPNVEATLTIPGDPGSTIWFWVGPTEFQGPVNEYDYYLILNLEPPVATSPRSWSSVKGLFR